MRCKHGMLVGQCASCMTTAHKTYKVTDGTDSTWVDRTIKVGIQDFIERFTQVYGSVGRNMGTFRSAFKLYYGTDYQQQCDYWQRADSVRQNNTVFIRTYGVRVTHSNQNRVTKTDDVLAKILA